MIMVQKAARLVAAVTIVTGGGIIGGMLVNSNTPSTPTQTQHVNLSGVEVSDSPSPTDTASDIAGSSASPAPPIYPSDSPSVVPIPLASDTPSNTAMPVAAPASTTSKPDDGTLPTDAKVASNPPGGGVPSIAPQPAPPSSSAPTASPTQ